MNEVSLSWKQLSHAMKSVWGRTPYCNVFFLGWLYPKLAQFTSKPVELCREVQHPHLDVVLLSASLFFGALRGARVTWIMGLIISLQPGCTCTGARALERGLGQEPRTVSAGKSLAVPARGTQPHGDIPVTKKLHQSGCSNTSPWGAPAQGHPEPFRDETNFAVC